MTQMLEDPLAFLAQQEVFAHATTPHNGKAPLTFADLLFAREAAGPPQRERKSAASLSSTEQSRLLGAFDVLNRNGVLGQFVAIHADMRHNQHMMPGPMGPVGAQRFLPWHRVFLYEFEKALRRVHADVTIPYWDWAGEPQIPAWLEDVKPAVNVPPPSAGPIQVTRSPGTEQALRQQADRIPQVTQANAFTAFEEGLEDVHDRIHVWVGGSMSLLSEAPADPLFYMHHANIDRIWSDWQQHHSGSHPALTGDDAIMDPWRVTELRTRDVTNFHYVYA
jgi:tyrosinase